MRSSTHLSTWITAESKQRFRAIATNQGVSESALLKRLIEQRLALAAGDDVALTLSLIHISALPVVRAVGEQIHRCRAMIRADSDGQRQSAMTREPLLAGATKIIRSPTSGAGRGFVIFTKAESALPMPAV